MENSIREVQVHISDALDQWADIMLNISAREKAHLLHYKDEDLINAIYIFEHVLANVGIHNLTIKNADDAIEAGNQLRDYVKRFTGIDTHELTKKVLGK